MHYYPHNIADFNNATRHLTRVQRSVYRDAIDLYYDKELPLVDDINKLEMRLMCHSDDEKNALKYILSEFFTETNDGYINERCDIEIAKYRANIGAKARAGIASAASRKNKSTDVKENSTHVQQNSTRVHNQELITNNQELINKTIRAKALVLPIPDFVDQQLWKDFIEVRHGLKAKNTLPAINALISQLKKLLDAGHNPADVINASIRSSWKDLYPLKENLKISEKDAGRKAAMASIFKPEHIQHLMKTEKVVQSAEFKRLAD